MDAQKYTAQAANGKLQRLPIPPKRPLVKAVKSHGMYYLVPVDPPRLIAPIRPALER